MEVVFVQPFPWKLSILLERFQQRPAVALNNNSLRQAGGELSRGSQRVTIRIDCSITSHALDVAHGSIDRTVGLDAAKAVRH